MIIQQTFRTTHSGIFDLFVGAVPPGGIEGLWITDLNLKDKVKDDAYLWMRTAVSRVQCALECTADARCMSHFYKETSATCIAQDVQLDSIDVRNSSGFLAYGLQTAGIIQSCQIVDDLTK